MHIGFGILLKASVMAIKLYPAMLNILYTHGKKLNYAAGQTKGIQKVNVIDFIVIHAHSRCILGLVYLSKPSFSLPRASWDTQRKWVRVEGFTVIQPRNITRNFQFCILK